MIKLIKEFFKELGAANSVNVNPVSEPSKLNKPYYQIVSDWNRLSLAEANVRGKIKTDLTDYILDTYPDKFRVIDIDFVFAAIDIEYKHETDTFDITGRRLRLTPEQFDSFQCEAAALIEKYDYRSVAIPYDEYSREWGSAFKYI